MNGYIYKCTIADKSYIGKTSGKPIYRFKVHIYDANVKKASNHFATALRGIPPEEAISQFQIIEEIECDTWDELEGRLVNRENYWIDWYNTIWPNGYNSLHSKPARRAHSFTQPPRMAVMRKIICLDTNEVFPSIATASRAYGVTSTAICNCVKGKTNTASGMHWKYDDEPYHQSSKNEGMVNHPALSITVICKETEIVYQSASEAERQTGISKSHILRSVHGTWPSAGGYHWGTLVDGKPQYAVRADRNKREVMCVETGTVYESITAAAKAIGKNVVPQSLGSAVRRGHRYKGFHYIYIDR